jgi:hypothetical protein
MGAHTRHLHPLATAHHNHLGRTPYGTAVAREFARHSHGGGGVTGVYTTATITEVAAAVAHLAGEPHPLVGSSPSPQSRDE